MSKKLFASIRGQMVQVGTDFGMDNSASRQPEQFRNEYVGAPYWTPKPNEECEWKPGVNYQEETHTWFPCIVLAIDHSQPGGYKFDVEGYTVTGGKARKTVTSDRLRPKKPSEPEKICPSCKGVISDDLYKRTCRCI